MRVSFVTLILLGAVLFLAPSLMLAGETAATMEAVKGEVKAQPQKKQKVKPRPR